MGDQIKIQPALDDQNRRHSNHKIPMLRFVVKHIHSGESSDRAAQNGEKEQGLLRNAPEMFLCLVFVDAHKGKTREVHKNEIDDDHIDKLHTDTPLKKSRCILSACFLFIKIISKFGADEKTFWAYSMKEVFFETFC